MQIPRLAFATGSDWSMLLHGASTDDWAAAQVERHQRPEMSAEERQRLHNYYSGIAPSLVVRGAAGGLAFMPAERKGTVVAVGQLYVLPPQLMPPGEIEKAVMTLAASGSAVGDPFESSVVESPAGPAQAVRGRMTGAPADAGDQSAPVYEVSAAAWWFPDVDLSMMLLFLFDDLVEAGRCRPAIDALVASADRYAMSDGTPAPRAVLPG